MSRLTMDRQAGGAAIGSWTLADELALAALDSDTRSLFDRYVAHSRALPADTDDLDALEDELSSAARVIDHVLDTLRAARRS